MHDAVGNFGSRGRTSSGGEVVEASAPRLFFGFYRRAYRDRGARNFLWRGMASCGGRTLLRIAVFGAGGGFLEIYPIRGVVFLRLLAVKSFQSSPHSRL